MSTLLKTILVIGSVEKIIKQATYDLFYSLNLKKIQNKTEKLNNNWNFPIY